MARRRDKYTVYQIVADAVGLTTLIVGTASIALGEITSLFSFMRTNHGGVEFVYRYLCAPVYLLVAKYLPTGGVDYIYIIVAAIFVVVVSALAYGVIAYLALRLLGALFGIKSD